ncbi:MAG: hypothetical protein II008_20430 [Oscillospiraceae bacterium]|nr:hypothetical protein [Oscillospiraceae bacterium]
MKCDHKTFRCTNGVFFCLTCGAEIPNPYEAEKAPEEKPAKKKGGKGK